MLLVEADYPIARLLEEADNFAPAGGIVPIFGLQCALHCDADVGFGNGTTAVSDSNARRYFTRIDAQDVAGGPMQTHQAEIARYAVLVIENSASLEIYCDSVGGVIALGR